MSNEFNPILGTQGAQTPNYDAFAKVNLQDFVGLLVTELQQQDPMNPMENGEILQQVSQIQSIESTQRLNQTLGAALLGQNMATATGLLGHKIAALTDDSQQIVGTVDRVSVTDGEVKVHIGENTIDLKNIQQIAAS